MNREQKLIDALRIAADMLGITSNPSGSRRGPSADRIRAVLAEVDASNGPQVIPCVDGGTAGPWHARIFSTGENLVMSRGYRVALCYGPGGIGKADALRIVACVNACAGIPLQTLDGAHFVDADEGDTPIYELVR